ncbi:MAG: DNA-directed RNA polymerase subunit omega [Campylobacter sp.]|nr:DNA-directed RNA polymerase subunit omega [Campylobacter sp.]
MRIEQIAAKALKRVNGDRYKLALMVSKRAEELALGKEILVDKQDIKGMKFADIAILEIAEGKVLFDGITKTDN